MKAVKSVTEYIAGTPADLQYKLRKLRKIITDAVPEAEERISYGMPYYGYKGRLAYFRYSKNHIGLYIPPPVVEEHAKELSSYHTASATVRFPLDKMIPSSIIKKLVRARMKKNEEASQKKR